MAEPLIRGLSAQNKIARDGLINQNDGAKEDAFISCISTDAIIIDTTEKHGVVGLGM